MAEYYPAALTAISRELYETLRQWAEARGDVAIIGGWAVVALVTPEFALHSRDVDLVFRTREALEDFQKRAPGWKLDPVLDLQDKRIVYAHQDDKTGTIVVDVFTTGGWGKEYFPPETNVLQTQLPFKGLLPPVAWLLAEKLRVIPLRMGKDATDKQEKDILDVHRLVFHNRDSTPPLVLLANAPRGARRDALLRIERCIKKHPAFADDYRKISEWLER